MNTEKDYTKPDILIIGAGPAGLAAAIRTKTLCPDADICVIDKERKPGNHNLSGAVLEPKWLECLLNQAKPEWREDNQAQDVLAHTVEKDDILFMAGKNFHINIHLLLKAAKILGAGSGQMLHSGDYSISVSKLAKWLTEIAVEAGIDVLTGFSAQDIFLNKDNTLVDAVRLVDQGQDEDGNKQPNFVPGEIIEPKFVVLAEGCDGLLTEKFIERAGLVRKHPQLYSVGVKELIKVSKAQYEKFRSGRVVHAMGYPLWQPLIGPDMFGGGILYAGVKEHISVGMIVGADWKYRDFNPQDALENFKKHKFVRNFIKGGTVVEAGAKMIPEGGYYAIPRHKQSGNIGTGNCLIVGDSAGFVNMLKIKGLHNALGSGFLAGESIAENFEQPQKAACLYTKCLEDSSIMTEMRSARNFRQTIAKFGPLIGMPLSQLGGLLPLFKVEKDYQAMRERDYSLKPKREFDKDTFTAMAGTQHRECQPNHLTISDQNICLSKCTEQFGRPCITFCPAGVYETVDGQVQPANPSNCLHCKTCQQKCPYDNIRWTVPEGSGGPRYNRM